MVRRKRELERIVGGCPCGFWARNNCIYVQAVGICRAGAMTLKHHCSDCGGKLREGRNGRPLCEDCLMIDEGEPRG